MSDLITDAVIEAERKREEERKRLEEEAAAQQAEQEATRELEAKRAAQEAEQEYSELEQAGFRMEMSQGIIQSVKNYAYHGEEAFGDVPTPDQPGRQAGVGGAFMQGMTFDRPDLFGTQGEGEPYGITQNAAKFMGSLLPVVAGTIVARVPFGYAMAEQGLQGTLAAILAEVGGGAVGADVPFALLADDMSTKERGAIVALGALAGALLPGNMRVGKIAETFVGEQLVKDTTKQGGVMTRFRDVINKATEQIEKSAEEVTPNFLKPDGFSSAVVKQTVAEAENYGEAVLDSFINATTSIRNNVDTYVAEQEARLKPYRLEPEEAAQHVNENINAEMDKLFNYAGHLTKKEMQMVNQAIKQEAWYEVNPDVLLNEVRVRQARAELDYEHTLDTGDKFSQRLLENTDTVTSKNGAVKTVDNSLVAMQTRVDDMVRTLQQVDDNAKLRLRPFTSEKARANFEELVQEVESNINTAWQREEVKQLKQDLDQIVALMADGNIPFSVGEGYASSVLARSLPDAIITAADIYKARPDILEAQLKALTEAITANDTSAGARYRDALREVEKYQHKMEHDQVDAVLKAHTNNEEIPKINSMAVYNASKQALKQQLRSEPEFADLATQVDQYAQFLPRDQAMPYVQQLDAALEEEANFILGDWNKAVELIADNPANKRMERNVVSYHTAMGNPVAKEYTQFVNNQPYKMVEPVAYLKTENVAHADSHLPQFKKGDPNVEPTIPGKGVGAGENPYAPDDFARDFDRAKIGSGFITRNLGAFFANLGVYQREAEKMKDIAGAKILQTAIHEAQDFRSAYNTYVHEVAEWNSRINNLFNNWKAQPTLEGAATNAVYQVSKEANIMERAGKSNEEITEWINDFIGKQSEAVRTEYHTFRGMMDEQFTRVQNTVINMNAKYGTEIPVPQYRPGYMHFAYEGEFLVKLSNGTTIPAVDSADLAAKLNELVERGGNFDDLSYQIIPRWSDAVEDFALGDSVMKDGSAFGINHRQLKEMYEVENKFRPDTVMKAVWGGMEERMLGLEKSKKGLYTATSIATRLSTRYVNMIEPAMRMRAQYNTLNKAGFINVAEEVKVWANDVLGISRQAEHNWDRQMNKIHDYINAIPGARYVADSLGMNEGARPLRSAMGLLAQVGRFLSIGFNPMTALLQTTIAPMNIFPLIGMGNFFKGLRHMEDFVVPGSRYERLAIRSGVQVKNATELGKSGSSFGFQRRISKPRVTQTALEAGIDKAEYYSMYMFNGVENIVRMASIWGAVRDAEKKAAKIVAGTEGKSHTYKVLKEISEEMKLPVTNPAVHDEYAYRMMEIMNFDFNTTGLNQLARNPFFKLPMQFKTYFFQEMEYIFGRKIPLTPTERFKTIGAMLALGGVASLPFADEMDDAMVWMTGKSPKLWMYENMPDVIAAGFPALVNINMSPLMQTGSTRSLALLPGLEGVLTNKLYRAYKEASTGQKTGIQAALGTSSLARNFTEAYEMFTTGKIMSPGGSAVVRRGGGLAAFGELMGVQTMQNTKSHELHGFYASLQRRNIKQRTKDRKAILGAKYPYQRGKELGYKRNEVKNMLEDSTKTKIEQSPKAQQILGVEGE